MIPLFILIAVPIVCRRISRWPIRMKSPQQPFTTEAQKTTPVILNVLIIAFMAVFSAVHISQIIHRQPEVESRTFPEQAVAFLQQHSPAGHIFNHYDWGGYLIWKLYPSIPVFIDGRADVYGESLFHDFADAYQLKSNWPQILQRWHIQTVLVPTDSALATGLRAALSWRVAYRDSQAIIFIAAPADIDAKTNKDQ